MVIYLFLLEEGQCYSGISNIRNTLMNKHAQSIVYTVTSKCHACSPLECTIIVNVRTHIDSYIDTDM